MPGIEPVSKIRIRPYRNSDRSRVEQICISTADERLKGNRMLEKALLKVFCEYYVDREPESCFVAANEQDEAVGYILCASSYERWQKEFSAILKKSWNPAARIMGKATLKDLEPFSKEYPAHLHIDLMESCQRQGAGSRLLLQLSEFLSAQGTGGLCLSVARTNEKGLNFYRKHGFCPLAESKDDILMGLKLPA